MQADMIFSLKLLEIAVKLHSKGYLRSRTKLTIIQPPQEAISLNTRASSAHPLGPRYTGSSVYLLTVITLSLIPGTMPGNSSGYSFSHLSPFFVKLLVCI